MSGNRVKIKPPDGGKNVRSRNHLMDILFNKLSVRFTKLIDAPDSYVVLCLNEDEVNKVISHNGVAELMKHSFNVIIPPHLKAKKTVILRGLDKEITTLTEEELKRDLEERNNWLKVEEIIKMKNIPYILKVRFEDIAMAHKATEQGVCIQMYHLGKNQVEKEDFIQLTPCWNCYKYDHQASTCPKKNETFCSECASTGHTFRECNNKQNPKCLNCQGSHRTLAAICPIRKQLIKDRRQEKKEKRNTFEKENRTYCEVTKLRAEIPKVATQPDTTTLQVDDNMPFKILTIIINAHLINIARPGSFAKSVKEMFKMNGLPTVNLPDNVPSSDIFKIVRGNSTNLAMDLQLQSYQDYQGEEGEEVCSDSEEELEMNTDPVRTEEEEDTDKDIEITKMKEKQTQVTKEGGSLGLRFYSSKSQNIPAKLKPDDLHNAIITKKVKFTYETDLITESEVIKYIKDGTFNTEKHPIKPVDYSSFKKIRTGHKSPQKSSGTLTKKRV